jgi:hypothetical protein
LNVQNKETNAIPAIAETSKSPVIQVEASNTTKHEHDYLSSEWFLVYITLFLAIVTGVLAFYTYRLWKATKTMVDSADATAQRQSSEMQASIIEAGRAATAMEQLVKSSAESVATLKDVTARQMRAYLVVNINFGLYQERKRNIKFEVRPSLQNTGQTPAHKMTYWARAKIMPFPLPENFDFPIPKKSPIRPMFLGPHQGVELNALVDDFVPDDEVADIKSGNTRRVYIWGVVTYTDIFNKKRTTKFCHSLYWFGSGENEKIGGNYAAHQNEAT